MGIDNPFGPPTMPSVITSNTVKAPENKPLVKPSTEAKATFNESATKTEDNSNLEIVQKILTEYNNIESDIPVNHNEYWAAKRRLNANR